MLRHQFIQPSQTEPRIESSMRHPTDPNNMAFSINCLLAIDGCELKTSQKKISTSVGRAQCPFGQEKKYIEAPACRCVLCGLRRVRNIVGWLLGKKIKIFRSVVAVRALTDKLCWSGKRALPWLNALWVAPCCLSQRAPSTA